MLSGCCAEYCQCISTAQCNAAPMNVFDKCVIRNESKIASFTLQSEVIVIMSNNSVVQDFVFICLVYNRNGLE
jgi:hypothetical protein